MSKKQVHSGPKEIKKFLLFFIPAGRKAHPTLSATFRIDPVSLLIGGGFIADLQIGAGLRF